jgi:Tol biopolymer transport system component
VGGIVRVATAVVVVLVLAGLFAAAPSASADKILYERVTYPQGERWWLIRPDGSHARRLPLFGTSQWPDLSLDGRRLVFVLLTNGALYTSPLADRRLRPVWRPHDLAWYPRWSPSGKRIAATTEVKPPSNWPENSNFFQVFVIRPGAGPPRRLRTPVSMRFASWSPDGRRIVAGSGRSETTCSGGPFIPPFMPVCETTFSSGLWVINVATGAAREIVHFDNELSGAPAWSPNGQTIAFNRTTAQGGVVSDDAHLWTVRPNGTGLGQLTRQPVIARQPSWSPDGRRLAVTIQRRGRESDIATIRADGSGLRVLTHSGNNFNPDWSR